MKENVKLSERLLTEKSIRLLKDYFKTELARNLNLHEVSAPLALISGVGINDDLNGVEKPVSFLAKSFPDQRLEIAQSLAKWKRAKLAEWQIPIGQGIITDMRALRPDEIISPIHSIYVDQWDWELNITKDQRNLEFLKRTVEKIYRSIVATEEYICDYFSNLKPFLPSDIVFIHSEELQYRYPKLTPKERENIVARDYGAVFIIGIGHELKDGIPHDMRAPDYDDWSTPSSENYKGLNGDIIVWNPILKKAFELSSMGIRVDKQALAYQLKCTSQERRLSLSFHSSLMNDRLPLSIGGGIGQSRLSMLLLRKSHIAEVQSSIWPKELVCSYSEKNEILL
jgi:aspartate--ammonia ligase